MSNGEPASLIPAALYKDLLNRHGFSQSEKGSRELLNEIVRDSLKSIVKHSDLQSSVDGHRALNRAHAQAAIEQTREIPRGYY